MVAAQADVPTSPGYSAHCWSERNVARAVVIYESLTGNTARAAQLIADEVAARGVEVAVYNITDIGLKELAEADVVFIGTWVDGLVLFGHRPGRAGRIRSMPVIDGKRVAAFMTYAIHAGKALDKFTDVLSERGASVVARILLRRDRLETGLDEFVVDALAAVPA
jgi:flavodoxin I